MRQQRNDRPGAVTDEPLYQTLPQTLQILVVQNGVDVLFICVDDMQIVAQEFELAELFVLSRHRDGAAHIAARRDHTREVQAELREPAAPSPIGEHQGPYRGA